MDWKRLPAGKIPAGEPFLHERKSFDLRFRIPDTVSIYLISIRGGGIAYIIPVKPFPSSLK